MKIANLIMTSLFVFGAVVQYNDPDALLWVAIYLSAAAACLAFLRYPGFVWLPVAIALICVGWALTLAPAVFGHIPFFEMFSAWEMKNVGVEESREMYGLLIIGFWMIVLTVQSIRFRRHLASVGS